MSIAEVRLWGTLVGAVRQRDGERIASFQYSDEAIDNGVELSPFAMLLSQRVYQFPALSEETFHGLPGMLADSLPDKFGTTLLAAWLAQKGRSLASFSPIERLCYTGKRGMGALEYEPAIGQDDNEDEKIDVGRLAELANTILRDRESFSASLDDKNPNPGLVDILRVGSSAGGARAKAVIAWNRTTGEVRSGQGTIPPGYEPWLLKFDGVAPEGILGEGGGYGRIEYAYHRMATQAGISMSECRLLEENGRGHFMTRRFDRDPSGRKLHMQSLGALAHLDYNKPHEGSYEAAIRVAQRLGLPKQEIEELYRRMVFNVVAMNRDDHVKNVAYLMGRDGTWALSPACDISYSYNAQGTWTKTHQMSISGKRENITREDLSRVARFAGLVRGREANILEEVGNAVRSWDSLAHEAGVRDKEREEIRQTFQWDLVSRQDRTSQRSTKDSGYSV